MQKFIVYDITSARLRSCDIISHHLNCNHITDTNTYLYDITTHLLRVSDIISHHLNCYHITHTNTIYIFMI